MKLNTGVGKVNCQAAQWVAQLTSSAFQATFHASFCVVGVVVVIFMSIPKVVSDFWQCIEGKKSGDKISLYFQSRPFPSISYCLPRPWWENPWPCLPTSLCLPPVWCQWYSRWECVTLVCSFLFTIFPLALGLWGKGAAKGPPFPGVL